MVGTRLLDTVIGDTIRNHPALFIFSAAVAGSIIFFSYSTFALKGDLINARQQMTQRLVALELKADVRDVESQIRSFESEIFELERIERAQEATRRDLRRLYDLKNKHRKLERGLDRLKARKL